MDSVLRELLKNSYSPISEKKVACIVKMKDGTMFKGVNVENPSFKSGLCAEQVAIGTAISEGYTKGDFESIHIMNNSGKFVLPCFLCRQNLVEFFENYEDNIVFSYTLEGKVKAYKFEELCPHAFRLEDYNE